MTTFRIAARSIAERILVRAPRRTGGGASLILAYHNVVPSGSTIVGDRSLHLCETRFRKQLLQIQQEADVVPLLDLLTTESSGKRRIAITFDDAYSKALSLGVSQCVAMGIPSTVFVAPNLLDTVPVWDRMAASEVWSDADRNRFLWNGRGFDDRRPPAFDGNEDLRLARIASRAELVAVASSALVTLGNHTMNHPNLGALDADTVADEVRSCSEWLSQLPGVRTVPVLAYPYGIPPRFGAPIMYGLMVRGGWHMRASVKGAIPRWNVPAGISDNGFRLRLRGWFT